ncbi:AT-rich interaction domain 6 [Silurus meridionalis]|nr:AT-rich interaction domain 6 [Silurus meridionalis]
MEQQDEQKEKKRERTESMTEESFLKDIYFFMKQRDTPIERIPHLGFKQINLYMMFKAVMELGGYHQVTAQQLWKKVYNILGGNPRSTSAATCTRRHYEKLLLPYEYHLAGYGDEIPITLPRQRKRFHPDEEYTEASKRADFTHLHQFNQYLPPGPISLPSYLAVSLPSIPPLSSPVHARPMMPYVPLPSAPAPAQKGNVEQSLEYLRHLAQEFKSSSGWTEPLNLSKKQGSLETSRNIPSSFTSPSTKKKEPKFLNEAPRLQQGNQLGICEAPAPAVRNQASRNETDVNNLTSCSSSPNLWKVAPKSPSSSTPSPSPSHRPPPPHHLPHPPPPPPHLLPPPPPPLPPHLPPQRPNYPCTVQAKLTTQQSLQVPVSKSGSSTTSQMNPGPTNSTYPSDPYGGMEIQIPLSLLQNLIKEGLILNTASHQPNPKPNETPSVPERTTAETNPDQPADLSLKNQTRNISMSEISINASKSVNGCQAPESKHFSLKLLQTPEIAKLPVYSHASHLKFPPRVFQEPQMYSKQVPSVPVRSPDQAGFKFPAYGRDAGQIGSINSGMRSEKTTLSPSLDKIKPPSGSFVQLNPEHLKRLFSGSQFRLESGKIC